MKEFKRLLITMMLALPVLFWVESAILGCSAPDTQGLFGTNPAHRQIENADPSEKISCQEVYLDPLANLAQANEDVQQQYQDMVDCVCHLEDPIIDDGGIGHHQFIFPELEYACKLNLVNKKTFLSLTQTILTDPDTSQDPVMIGRFNVCQALVEDCH